MPVPSTRPKVNTGKAALSHSISDDVHSLKGTITQPLARTVPTKDIGEVEDTLWYNRYSVPEREVSNVSRSDNKRAEEAGFDQDVLLTPTSTEACAYFLELLNEAVCLHPTFFFSVSSIDHEQLKPRVDNLFTDASACYNDLQSLLCELEMEREALRRNRDEMQEKQQEAMENLENAEREIEVARLAKKSLEAVILRNIGRDVLLDLLELCGQRIEIEEDEEEDMDEIFKEEYVKPKATYAVPYGKQKPSAVRGHACYTDAAPAYDADDVSSLHVHPESEAGGSATGRGAKGPLHVASVPYSGKGKGKRRALDDDDDDDEDETRDEPQRKKARSESSISTRSSRDPRILTSHALVPYGSTTSSDLAVGGNQVSHDNPSSAKSFTDDAVNAQSQQAGLEDSSDDDNAASGEGQSTSPELGYDGFVMPQPGVNKLSKA
ncbi:hypothetical protein DFH11DRAFT_1545187 [Phellopilus nigrolimitatus]|nr:hypothetical protein DFH11DRAFT_1545187 [Phellopilus nigrolimitatus]